MGRISAFVGLTLGVSFHRFRRNLMRKPPKEVATGVATPFGRFVSSVSARNLMRKPPKEVATGVDTPFGRFVSSDSGRSLMRKPPKEVATGVATPFGRFVSSDSGRSLTRKPPKEVATECYKFGHNRGLSPLSHVRFKKYFPLRCATLGLVPMGRCFPPPRRGCGNK